jgi:hypothetical protein
VSTHTIVLTTDPDKHPIDEIERVLEALTAVEVMQRHDEHMLEMSAEERAKARATCSVCLARTYRGNEECVCEDGGDAEDFDEALRDEQNADVVAAEARADRDEQRPNISYEGARFVAELPIAQLKSAASWADDGENMAPTVRLWALEDGSLDVHQSDAYTNIDEDGTVKG